MHSCLLVIGWFILYSTDLSVLVDGDTVFGIFAFKMVREIIVNIVRNEKNVRLKKKFF